MVHALVEIDETTNRILNMVKARRGLKDKGKVIQFIVQEYAEYEQEPELKREFIEKMKKIEKQKSIHVDDFAKRYGLS